MAWSRPATFWIGLGIVFLAAVLLLREILLSFVAGLVLAYLLNPLANRLERHGLNRLIAALVIIGGSAIVFVGLLLLTVPIIARELAYFLDNLPVYFRQLEALTNDESRPWPPAEPSLRRGGLLGGVPPQRRPDPDHDGDDERDEQRGLLQPGDRGNAERQDDADEADAPCRDVDTGGERAEREQGQNVERARIRAHGLSDVGDVEQIHGSEDGRPMKCLRPHEVETLLAVVRRGPPRHHTHDSDEGREHEPIERHRRAGDARIGDAEQR
jgi:hypothetical protein